MPIVSLKQTCDACTRCELYKGNKQSVVYRGSPSAKIVFVAEAPGRHEDELGQPLVGPAGQVFQNALDKLGLKETDYLCTNTVLHRPPNNRVPTKQEIEACSIYVNEIIREVKPRVIFLLGSTALKTFHPDKDKASITRLRGQFFSTPIQLAQDDIKSYLAIASWHPSYLLRLKGSEKGNRAKLEFWEDLNKAWRLVNE